MPAQVLSWTMMDHDSDDQRPDLRSFGRRRGRKPSARQADLWHSLLPKVRVDLTQAIQPALNRPLWLEIGFGGGEHLLWQAENNPDVDFIGCEPFEDGVIKVLTAIDEKTIRNIRLHPDDVRLLLRRMPDASLDRAFVLFPDPWPKRKHQKRRLVAPALLADLARTLRSGAHLRLATDIPDYARTMLMAMQSQPQFRWLAQRPADWTTRPLDWPGTRYEAKAVREGRRSCYMTFERV